MQPPVIFILFFIGFVVIAIGLMVWGHRMEQKKREAFRLVAARLGLTYEPEQNRGLAAHFAFLNLIKEGENRYASHVLRGRYEEHDVLAFEFHYETHSTDSKGKRSTRHYYFSVFTTSLPKSFPELTIRPEGMFSKIAQALGYADIDFESAEFSRKFCVRSPDKKFAYAVCHPLAMEFLLECKNGLNFEIEGTTMAMIGERSMAAEDVEPGLRLVLAFRRLFPDYLLKATA